jgi:ribosomal protein S21
VLLVDFKRKKGESFESFLRRFNKSLIQSRKLNLARSKKYFARKKNKNQQKEYALVSRKMREKKEYLRKIGKLVEETKNRW